MQTDRFDFLRKQFSSFEIKLSEDCNTVEIVNPFGNENVKVEYVPEDDFTPYIVYFAFQHCHMCDEEDIADYMNDIIDGKVFSIEFFNKGTRCFGGDITAAELDSLTYETLTKYIESWGISNLLDYADSFKLRGWHSNYNFDAELITDENGLPRIKKLG